MATEKTVWNTTFYNRDVYIRILPNNTMLVPTWLSTLSFCRLASNCNSSWKDEPKMPIFGPKCQFWAKFGRFWAQNPIFWGQGVKILVPSYRDSNETPFSCWKHWSVRLQLAARGENVLFWPKNLDIWGQKSIFFIVIARSPIELSWTAKKRISFILQTRYPLEMIILIQARRMNQLKWI